ncbi:hypothetical protein M426DRAFT_318557 [Hypoxylon sp. CI-4A]|nr:hypothetical protein M426DRAFT_318557 [Hypoxylon sp. CI-4A]
MALGRWTFPSSRKQSSTSSSGNRTNGTTTPTDNESQDAATRPSRLFRSLTGGFRSSHKSKKSTERDEYAHLNRPFNQQNLEHQKILNAFEWNFGRTRQSSHGGRSSMSEISPSASRNTSVDHGPPTDMHSRFDSALAREPTREDPREESRK